MQQRLATREFFLREDQSWALEDGGGGRVQVHGLRDQGVHCAHLQRRVGDSWLHSKTIPESWIVSGIFAIFLGKGMSNDEAAKAKKAANVDDHETCDKETALRKAT